MKRLMAVWSSTTERKTPRLHAAADNLVFEHVEGGEEGRGAVADIVVGHSAAAPFLDRQARLGPVEGYLAAYPRAENIMVRVDPSLERSRKSPANQSDAHIASRGDHPPW